MALTDTLVDVGRESKVASCVHLPVRRFDAGGFCERGDSVIQEVELAVMVNGALHHEATCSPWDVRELVVGNLFLSGELDDPRQLRDVRVDLAAGTARVEIDERRAAQGCSRTRVEAVRGGGVVLDGLFDADDTPLRRSVSAVAPVSAPKAVSDGLRISAAEVNRRIALLEDRSLLFRRTGGVHSAVLADEGGIVAWFEDIGRHSAVDKLAGWCFLNGVDVSDKVLLFSGRVPREIIVKVVRLGCPVIVSPGAPTTLSIQLAEEGGVTLVGFAKRGAFNVYAHPERIEGLA